MSTKTTIQWTDATWSPVRGCSRVSPGCENCYAERQAARFKGPGQPYEGLVRTHPNGEPRWSGTVRLVPERLFDPIRWRRPRRVFVNSMSDLFHESLSDEDIAAVFGVMAACPQHTFQVLTKRAKRMREWVTWISQNDETTLALRARNVDAERLGGARLSDGQRLMFPWPLPNLWLGVSVEDQRRADERIPDLLACPAAVRWVSYEPALGPVDFDAALRRVDWIVVGGESGPGARPFDPLWARSTILQCREAGVPIFVKQMGARPIVGGQYDLSAMQRDPKGADPAEWPAELRVREWPATYNADATSGPGE